MEEQAADLLQNIGNGLLERDESADANLEGPSDEILALSDVHSLHFLLVEDLEAVLTSPGKLGGGKGGREEVVVVPEGDFDLALES